VRAAGAEEKRWRQAKGGGMLEQRTVDLSHNSALAPCVSGLAACQGSGGACAAHRVCLSYNFMHVSCLCAPGYRCVAAEWPSESRTTTERRHTRPFFGEAEGC
jgi:hypothetical protein